MKRILSHALAASAICAMAISTADAATRKHYTHNHYASAAAKLRSVANRQLAVSEPYQTGIGRSIGDNSCFRTLSYLPSSSACGGAGGF